MNVDECIAEMWRIENEQTPEDGSGWVTYDLASDHWWILLVFCSHGSDYVAGKPLIDVAVAHAGTVGPMDLEAGFNKLLNEFRRTHGA